VPIDATTLRIVSALMREGRYRRAYLGVAGGPLPPRIAKQLGRPTAVQVLQVVDGSPVALAGVQAGDRILDVDGNDPAILTKALREKRSRRKPWPAADVVAPQLWHPVASSALRSARSLRAVDKRGPRVND
jgi:S1-C subfamily serine protease